MQHKKCFIVLFTGICFFSCSTVTFPDYHPDTSALSAAKMIQDGLEISVVPMHDRSTVRNYFGKSVEKRGVVPIFILARNATTDRNFILRKDRTAIEGVLTSASGDGNVDYVPSGQSKGGEAATVVGSLSCFVMPAVGMPLMFSGIKASNDALATLHNYKRNEFRSGTLAPGETQKGFLFFVPEENQTVQKVLKIRVVAEVVPSSELVQMEVEL